jgi:hypothetical protein
VQVERTFLFPSAQCLHSECKMKIYEIIKTTKLLEEIALMFDATTS